MVIDAEHKSKFAALTGNGDVSIWVKIFRVGRKTLNRQTNELLQSLSYLKRASTGVRFKSKT